MPGEEKKHKNPIPAVDIILRKSAAQAPQKILIEKRGRDPYIGRYCLPGGHVDYGETVEAAVLRELKEECDVAASLEGIFGVYSDPKRDPRGQRISTVFLGNYVGGEIKAGDDAGFAGWIDAEKLLKDDKENIAFDHAVIIRDYLTSLKKNKGSETFWSTKSGR